MPILESLDKGRYESVEARPIGTTRYEGFAASEN
jgi:hypothetical protein